MPRRDKGDEEKLRRATGIRIRYEPWGAAKDIFSYRGDELCLVGPKGTGKSLAALHKLHLVLSKWPNAQGFMCRKTRTSMTNSCMTMFNRQVLKPIDRVTWHGQDQQYRYPNGAILAVLGLDKPDRLNSSQWDIGYMMEATEAIEHDWEICTACIRNGIVPYQQMMGCCNPDKPRHWLRQRMLKGLCQEFKSIHQDNPKFYDRSRHDWTAEGLRYINKLQRLSGVRYTRLFKGEWAAAEGVVYDTFDPAVHVISRSQLPIDWVDWPHFWSIDFGHTHPFVWQDWMQSPSGVLYLNRELYKTKLLVEDAAEYIMGTQEGLPKPLAIICDHDAEGRATFERHTELLTLGAYKPITPGVQAVQKRMRPEWEHQSPEGVISLGPGIMFLDDAPLLEDEDLKDAGDPYTTVGEIDGYVWDKKHNEIVANSKKDEIPLDKDNHGCDAARYIVAFIDSLVDDPQDVEGLMLYGDEDEVEISRY